MAAMCFGAEAVEQLDFDELFKAEEVDTYNDEGSSSDDGATNSVASIVTPSRQVSSLTVGIQTLTIQEEEPDDFVNDVASQQPTVDMTTTAVMEKYNWNILSERNTTHQLTHANLLRMGTSAPVNIPNVRSWQSRHPHHPAVEEESDGLIRATTFVPPHLMVERPDIQFSLNSGIAQKRATLKARNKIFQMTGFLECETNDKEWNKEFIDGARVGAGWLSKELSIPNFSSSEK